MSRPLHSIYRDLPPGSAVLDVGCLDFGQRKLAMELGRTDLRHSGVDYSAPEGPLPEGYSFGRADLDREPIPFPDDAFDLVVASHVIEHLADGVAFVGECLRVCKPGGRVYVEAPSERSLWLPGMPFQKDQFYSLSFFDDPTHRGRPWTPQALHRLARYYGCEPESGRFQSLRHLLLLPLYLAYAWLRGNGKKLEHYCWLAVGWSCYGIFRKPSSLAGKSPFRYYVPPYPKS